MFDAVEGWRQSGIVRDHRGGIDGVCGDACSSGHAPLAPEWTDKLDKQQKEQTEPLDASLHNEPTSLLTTQTISNGPCGGLKIQIGDAG